MFKSFKVSFARDLIERNCTVSNKFCFHVDAFSTAPSMQDIIRACIDALILRMGDENIINMQVGGFEDLKFYNEPEYT
ncbi:hypothetical protein T4D_1426 [Trichinella pseudospiralis]|uniref:Uncharacterized protein n=1 Tax=Trichinella pseudospiralis TaxID=6337 RepID=A0A0V1FS94_TRIPS|nr:hypothetical protein T4D_1426 [Trichinella pseudospiralis]